MALQMALGCRTSSGRNACKYHKNVIKTGSHDRVGPPPRRGGWSRLIIRSRALYVCTQGPQPSPTQLSAFHSLEVSFVF